MNRTVTLVLAVAGLLAAACVLHAAPIVGASANTIPAGRFMFDVWATWQDYTVEYVTDENEDQENSTGWQSLHNGEEITSGSFVPRVYYGVTDLLTIRAALPIEDRYYLSGEQGEEGGKSNTGIGDIIIDPKFRLTKGTNGYPVVSLLAGVRFPTGDTKTSNPRIAPLSDGSTDYMLGAAVTHVTPLVTAHVTGCYWINGERTNGTRGGNLWVGLATLESNIDESWTLLWEFKGVFNESNSDYLRTYVCPGVEWRGERLTLGFSAVVSASAKGGVGPGAYDFDWAPYMRVYYRLF